jgi:hypothetical protein
MRPSRQSGQGVSQQFNPGHSDAAEAASNFVSSNRMPTGYEYREYKNWLGIPKPRRCPFCKQAKAEIRKVRGAFQGVCPSCGAMGPKREDHEAALLAWNGKGVL